MVRWSFFKLRQNGISADIINILQDFLHDRKQRVVLNGQFSVVNDINTSESDLNQDLEKISN